MGFSLCPEWGHEGMKDVLARCHKKTAVQVCTLTILHCHLVSSCIHVVICLLDYPVFDYPLPALLHVGSVIRNANWCLFSLVKNKPWRTRAYTWFWHRREQVAINMDGSGQCSKHSKEAQPRTCASWSVYINIVLYFSSSHTVFWNAPPNGYLHSTDNCYIF